MINHRYKNNICKRCGCVRVKLWVKETRKWVYLYNGISDKGACII